MSEQPKIYVGILTGSEIEFELNGEYLLCGEKIGGTKSFKASFYNQKILVNSSDNKVIVKRNEIIFEPVKPDSSLLLKNVTIGVDFHWEQKEDQEFRGGLKLILEEGKIRAINIVQIEEYLRSVISSEMSATSSPELLKAHAVISRSWLLAQVEKSKNVTDSYKTSFESEIEITRWYDREDHANFDVCADDHCQRYQGITKIISDKALEAVDQTLGMVLMSEDEICDARFSKCCGGISENFELVWEPQKHAYLTSIVDAESKPEMVTDLRNEAEAENWIRSSPDVFCNTKNERVLRQVLPGFDQATSDFFRWKLSYSQNELSEIIKQRSRIDFGQIIKLVPVERGYSGRLVKLKIVGTKRSMIIGKELEIRRTLSSSHLYSSAFVVDHIDIQNEIPQQFVLVGAGWGHGVGLCQIGAAMMGEKGYSFHSILKHYFKGAELKKFY